MADKRLIDANTIPWEECFIPVECQQGWKLKREECVYKPAIDQMPTVDAVPVVRCAECKKCSHDTMFGTSWCHGHEVKPDDFCSYGERRTDD